MPCTVPLQDRSARGDSRWGTRTWKLGFWLRSPMVSREKLAPLAVRYRASAAAIFMGWYTSMSLACKSPETATSRVLTKLKAAARRDERQKAPRSSALAPAWWARQALVPSTRRPAVAKAAKMVWANEPHSSGLARTAQKSVSTAWPPATL